MNYQSSEGLLERALKTIPMGCQTFSKSYVHYPKGRSPFFAEKGDGSYLYDVDGNRYIDVVSALAAVTLGYSDKDVNSAIKQQLEKGIIYSLSAEPEVTLAEKITSLIPCAEMVRFGKNGSDATTAAIRLSRAYTGRDEVVVCGYHGWHDWYIGSTDKNLGVPDQVRQLTHTFSYNNTESLKSILNQRKGKIAAVIMEPMNMTYPETGFLQSVRELCSENKTLLIFDETVTGFRFGMSGAQGVFGVIPDLATFGKGIANGMPLSVLTGKEEIMSLLSEVFYSFTYGGELLSIAAALETIRKMENLRVPEHLEQHGNILKSALSDMITERNLNHLVSVSGHPSWSFFNIHPENNDDIYKWKTLYMQEMIKRKVICLGTHNLTLSHTNDIITDILNVYSDVLDVFHETTIKNDLEGRLETPPLQPLFSVRKR